MNVTSTDMIFEAAIFQPLVRDDNKLNFEQLIHAFSFTF